MKYDDKTDIVAGLRKAMGDDRPIFARECMDGRYIDERIAFEMYSDEEKAALRKKYAKTDAQIEQQKQELREEAALKNKFNKALDEYNHGKRPDNKNRFKDRYKNGDQFFTS